MNTRLWFLLVAPLVFLSGCGGGPSWQEFTSNEGKFRVLMYGKPTEETKEEGSTTAHTFQVTPRKGVTYMVLYFDSTHDPKERGKPDYIEKTLTAYCLQTEKNLEGKIQSAKRVQLANHLGREIVIEAPKDLTYRIRYFLVGDRCYQVLAAGPKDSVTSEEADKFLNSFRPIE